MALAAAGCGGDSEESSERPRTSAEARTDAPVPQRGTTEPASASQAGATLTAAEYRRTTNRLCREDKAAGERFGDLDSPESIVPYLRRTIRYARKREPLYERLRPPPDLRASHQASMRLNDRAVSALADLLARVEKTADPAEEFTQAAPLIGRLLDENNRLARRLGTEDCIVELPSAAQSSRSSS
jgi:hypothetical protein